MIQKIIFGVVTILAAASGVIALTGEPVVAAAFGFGAAAVSAVFLAYLIGRDAKQQSL